MTQAPTFYPRTVVSRTDQLGVAHDLARKLGYETRRGHDRSRYEARLESLIGRRSLKGASREDRHTVIQAFEAELSARRPAPRPLDPSEFSDDACLELLG